MNRDGGLPLYAIVLIAIGCVILVVTVILIKIRILIGLESRLDNYYLLLLPPKESEDLLVSYFLVEANNQIKWQSTRHPPCPFSH